MSLEFMDRFCKKHDIICVSYVLFNQFDHSYCSKINFTNCFNDYIFNIFHAKISFCYLALLHPEVPEKFNCKLEKIVQGKVTGVPNFHFKINKRMSCLRN